MDKVINNVVLHKELNELKILNKFYIENGEVKEKEFFDLYLDNTTNEGQFLEDFKNKYLKKLDLDIYFDNKVDFNKDEELSKAFSYLELKNNFNKNTTSFTLFRSKYSLSQKATISPYSLKALIILVKKNLDIIKSSNEPEKIIYNFSDLKGFKNDKHLLELDDSNNHFLLSNIVLFEIFRFIYRIEVSKNVSISTNE